MVRVQALLVRLKVSLVLLGLGGVDRLGGRARQVADLVVVDVVVVVDCPRAAAQGAELAVELQPGADDVPVDLVPRRAFLVAQPAARGQPELQAGLYVVADCPEVRGSKGMAAPTRWWPMIMARTVLRSDTSSSRDASAHPRPMSSLSGLSVRR